jgi:hypothetical protein
MSITLALGGAGGRCTGKLETVETILSSVRTDRTFTPDFCITKSPGKPGGAVLYQDLPDTVGEFKSTEMGVPHMPSLKAKTLRELTQEKVLLELGRRFANSNS